MDDDKTNANENQPETPHPIFETVPEEGQNPIPETNLKPEEIAPEIATPEDASSVPPLDMSGENQPLMYEEHKGKYLIIIVVLLLFFALIFFIIKSLFSGKTPAKKITLTYWGLWEEKEVFEPLIKEYSTQYPHVIINYQKKSVQDYRDKLIVRSKNGEGPDIFRYHNTWLPEIKEVVAPLPQKIMSNNEFEAIFYPIHQKDLKMGAYYYGLPLMIDGLILVYNDALFKKAGISVPPTTWEDVLDYANKLSVKDKSTGQLFTSGIALGTANNIEHFSDIFGLMLLQNGGSLDELDKLEAVKVLEVYRKFAEPPTDYWSSSMPNSITAFMQEKVAMIIVPSWEILTIKSANPEISLKVTTIPTLPLGKPMSIASYWVEGVSRFSKNQLEAWKFLKFLTEKESLAKLYEIQSKLRLFGEPYPRSDMSSLLIQNEYIGPVIKQANSDAFVSIPTIGRTFDNGLNDEINKYLENAINSTMQGVSYEEALKTAKQGIDQIMNRYKTN